MISAIVLAAGESRRMGQTKQLLAWQGHTLLGWVLDALAASPVDEIIVVVGHEGERVAETISLPQVKTVSNPEFREGMSTSLRRGLMAMDLRSEAFLVVLADQPAVSPKLIGRLIREYRKSSPPKTIAVPMWAGRRGHPVLFARNHLSEFLALTGDVGGREILARHPEEVLPVEAGDDTVLLDVDTPEDYENLSRRPAP